MDNTKLTFSQILRAKPINWNTLWNWYCDKIESITFKVIDFVKDVCGKVVAAVKKK